MLIERRVGLRKTLLSQNLMCCTLRGVQGLLECEALPPRPQILTPRGMMFSQRPSFLYTLLALPCASMWAMPAPDEAALLVNVMVISEQMLEDHPPSKWIAEVIDTQPNLVYLSALSPESAREWSDALQESYRHFVYIDQEASEYGLPCGTTIISKYAIPEMHFTAYDTHKTGCLDFLIYDHNTLYAHLYFVHQHKHADPLSLQMVTEKIQMDASQQQDASIPHLLYHQNNLTSSRAGRLKRHACSKSIDATTQAWMDLIVPCDGQIDVSAEADSNGNVSVGGGISVSGSSNGIDYSAGASVEVKTDNSGNTSTGVCFEGVIKW